MILWEKSDCSPDWTELLSTLADLAKLTEKCSKNCGLLPYFMQDVYSPFLHCLLVPSFRKINIGKTGNLVLVTCFSNIDFL